MGFDAKQAAEDAERCRRVSGQRQEESITSAIGEDEEEVAFWVRLASYPETLLRVEGLVESIRSDAAEFTMLGKTQGGGALYCVADRLEAAMRGEPGGESTPSSPTADEKLAKLVEGLTTWKVNLYHSGAPIYGWRRIIERIDALLAEAGEVKP